MAVLETDKEMNRGKSVIIITDSNPYLALAV